MFILANIGNIVTVIIATLIFFFLHDIKTIPLFYIIFLCYIDIWFYKLAFEYQRITLIISRIAKLNYSSFSIQELQILMTDNSLAFLLFLKSFLTGFIISYFLLNSLLFLIIFLLFQYLLNFFIPTYIPYNFLFKLINKELNNRKIRNAEEYIEKIKLSKYFNQLPHNSDYENWAFKIHGNKLLQIK